MIDERMIEDSRELERLDGMVGQLAWDEMYQALDLPVVVVLRSDNDADLVWAVLAGRRGVSEYAVQGIVMGNGADGFRGNLSLDGRSLSTGPGAGQAEPVSLIRYGEGSRPTLSRLLQDFAGRPTPFDPIDDTAVADARSLVPAVRKGMDIYDAIASVTEFKWQRISIFRTLLGWYRTREWEAVRDKHWPEYSRNPNGPDGWQLLVQNDLAKVDNYLTGIKVRLGQDARKVA